MESIKSPEDFECSFCGGNAGEHYEYEVENVVKGGTRKYQACPYCYQSSVMYGVALGSVRREESVVAELNRGLCLLERRLRGKVL